MSLVLITDSMMVNTDEIAEVQRCGNYTNIRILGRPESWRIIEIWDENKVVWNRIQKAIQPC